MTDAAYCDRVFKCFNFAIGDRATIYIYKPQKRVRTTKTHANHKNKLIFLAKIVVISYGNFSV